VPKNIIDEYKQCNFWIKWKKNYYSYFLHLY
jgi:hypothetical protein